MSSDDATNTSGITGAAESGSTDTRTDTPLFDATARALAAATATRATASASQGINPEDTNTDRTVVRANEPATSEESAEKDWVDQRYGDPSKPPPVIDPDTPEGAAILQLFRQIKDIEKSDGRWPAVDVVAQLTTWFTALGIDPDEHPRNAEQRLRLAQPDAFGGRTASVYGARIGTHHDDPELIVRTALHVLARQLGPGTSIDLVSQDRNVLARLEHPPAPTAGS